MILMLIVFGNLSKAHAEIYSLDNILTKIKSNRAHNPFAIGEKAALRHPDYKKIKEFATFLNVDIKWTPSVSAYVLKLDFLEERYKVKKTDEFDGWFDEFTDPQLIIIHQESNLVTLLHEMRHALHLGRFTFISNQIELAWFDQFLLNQKKNIQKYHEWINQNSQYTNAQKKKYRKCATRILETASEISAHAYDVELAESFKHPHLTSFKSFIKDYLKEHLKNQKCLLENSEKGKGINFAFNIEKRLIHFMNEKKLL